MNQSKRRTNGAGWWSVALLAGLLTATAASAQTLQQRIDDMNRREARAQERADEEARAAAEQVNARLEANMSFVVTEVSVRDALDEWSALSGVPLLVNWHAMENEGVDPDKPLTIELAEVQAEVALLFIMDQMSEDLRFIAETESWGVRLRSRPEANRDVQTHVYDIRDLLVDVPNFTDAPRLSLQEALSNTNSGGSGSGSGGGGGIFDVEEAGDADGPLSKRERGELLVQLVRDTIEPDVWRDNGGEFSRIRYSDGKMIVRAPLYVHVQIGREALR